MLRGKRVSSLGYTTVGAAPIVLGAPRHAVGSLGVPSVTPSRRVTVVVPTTPQPSVAVTVITPPAPAVGVSEPATMVPGGVASARVALHARPAGSMSAVCPSGKLAVAVNAMGAGAAAPMIVVASAGDSAMAVAPVHAGMSLFADPSTASPAVS